MNKNIKRVGVWLPVILWCSIIFYLSSFSIPFVKAGFFDYTIIGHMIEFGVLAFFMWQAVAFSFKVKERKVFLWSAILAILYAISDEIHQYFVPLRHGSIMDVLFDTAGIIIVLLIIWKSRITQYIQHH